jgi:hypothetical protein
MADLEKLEDEERGISRRRAELLAEIDRLHPSAPLGDTDAARLKAIQEEERGLSARRRTLQHQIDGLRLRLRLPQGPRTD